MGDLHLTLPWPVSLNALYRSIIRYRMVKGVKKPFAVPILSAEGRQYQKDARLAIRCSPAAGKKMITGPVALTIYLHPKTKRKYDCDNFVKCIQDALTYCKVWEDDKQVYILHVEKRAKNPPGAANVIISEIDVDFVE